MHPNCSSRNSNSPPVLLLSFATVGGVFSRSIRRHVCSATSAIRIGASPCGDHADLVGGRTFLIGLLPTYEAAGVCNTRSGLVVRRLAGLRPGAEYGGAVILPWRHALAGQKRRGLFGQLRRRRRDIGLCSPPSYSRLCPRCRKKNFLNWAGRIPFCSRSS